MPIGLVYGPYPAKAGWMHWSAAILINLALSLALGSWVSQGMEHLRAGHKREMLECGVAAVATVLALICFLFRP